MSFSALPYGTSFGSYSGFPAAGFSAGYSAALPAALPYGYGGYAVPPAVTHPAVPNPEVALGQKTAQEQIAAIEAQARAHEQEVAAAQARAHQDTVAHATFVATQNETARNVSVSRTQQGIQSAAAAEQAVQAANAATQQMLAASAAETQRANQAAAEAFAQAQQAALAQSAAVEAKIRAENEAAVQRVLQLNQVATQQFQTELAAKTAEGRQQTEVSLSVLRASQEEQLRKAAAEAEAVRSTPPVSRAGQSFLPTAPRPDVVHPPTFTLGAESVTLPSAYPFGGYGQAALPSFGQLPLSYGQTTFPAQTYGAFPW